MPPAPAALAPLPGQGALRRGPTAFAWSAPPSGVSPCARPPRSNQGGGRPRNPNSPRPCVVRRGHGHRDGGSVELHPTRPNCGCVCAAEGGGPRAKWIASLGVCTWRGTGWCGCPQVPPRQLPPRHQRAPSTPLKTPPGPPPPTGGQVGVFRHPFGCCTWACSRPAGLSHFRPGGHGGVGQPHCVKRGLVRREAPLPLHLSIQSPRLCGDPRRRFAG